VSRIRRLIRERSMIASGEKSSIHNMIMIRRSLEVSRVNETKCGSQNTNIDSK
jgi:hypothetical protein